MFENCEIDANHSLRTLLTEIDPAIERRYFRRPRHDAETPLMAAIKKKRVKIVRMLLHEGADASSPPREARK